MHEQQSNTRLCLSKQCNLPRMFCELCLPDHKKHEVIPYSQFEKRYYQFQKIYASNTQHVKKVTSPFIRRFSPISETPSRCALKEQNKEYSSNTYHAPVWSAYPDSIKQSPSNSTGLFIVWLMMKGSRKLLLQPLRYKNLIGSWKKVQST